MKITKEHYLHLKTGLQRVLAYNGQSYDEITSIYAKQGLPEMRCRWDLYTIAQRYDEITPDTTTLYTYLSDTHIDTALRKALEEINT